MFRKKEEHEVKVVWHDGRWHVRVDGRSVDSFATAVEALVRKTELEAALRQAA